MSDTARHSPHALQVGSRGIDLIQSFEGFRSHWYRDARAVPTIGYGTTEKALAGITRRGMPGPIDRATAVKLLLKHLEETVEPCIRRVVDTDLTQNEYDALCSFTYNIGCGAFAGSTLLRFLNAGSRQRAAEEFGRWVYAGGEELEGLVRRRAAERALFEDDPERMWDIEPVEVAGAVPLPTPDVDELASRHTHANGEQIAG